MKTIESGNIMPKLEKYFYEDFIKELPQNNISVFGGLSGTLFLNSVLCLNNKTLDRSVYIDKNIQFIIDMLEKTVSVSSSFSNGLAGFGFCLDYIQKNKLSNFDLEDLLTEIDKTVEVGIKQCVERNNLDLLHGALGIGCYLISRKHNEKIIDYLINVLEKKSIKKGNEIKWQRYDEYRSKQYVYDFGLAHGNAGILYFLGKAYKNGINKNQCYSLINGVISFYKNNLQDPNKSGSYFPNFKGVENYEGGAKESYSRLAWCYGDLGIFYTINLVSKWISNEKLEKFSVQGLIQTAKRMDFQNTSVEDPYFCHGTSGISYIYSKMYLKTGKRVFKDASKYWLKETFSYSSHENKISANYFSKSTTPLELEKNNSLCLLDGLGGITAVLSSLNNPKSTDWDEVFFLT